MRKIRASYYFIGSMLGRFGIGQDDHARRLQLRRPADRPAHQGHDRAGRERRGQKRLCLRRHAGRHACTAAKVYLDKVSVGATMNIILAATLGARPHRHRERGASEPHIVDLANFLNSMGADIRGAGTDSIKIHGVDSLHGGTLHDHPRPDRGGHLYGRPARRPAGKCASRTSSRATWSASAPSCARWASPSSRTRTACS